MPLRRAAAARGSLRVVGVEPPLPPRPPPVPPLPLPLLPLPPRSPLPGLARRRGDPCRVRLLLLSTPSGSAPLLEIPSQRAAVLGSLCLRTHRAGAGGLRCRGPAREGSLTHDLGGCQAPGPQVTVSC